MENLERLKAEMGACSEHMVFARDLLMARGYEEHMDAPNMLARARAFAAMLDGCEKIVYENDLVAGSLRGILVREDEINCGELERAKRFVGSFGERRFVTNCDHYAPDYETFLRDGVGGTLQRIDQSKRNHAGDAQAQLFLDSTEIAMRAFGRFIETYAAAARTRALECPRCHEELIKVAQTCEAIKLDAPSTFREALQLMWLAHIAFCCEGRYAMALGRMDQILQPYFERDRTRGELTEEDACALIACTLYKIGERRLMAGDDVVNIAIGGVDQRGEDAVNALSFLILKAVGLCNIPGPNLSARLHRRVSEEFLDACLKVIGTGLGYPALMNDEVNISALKRHGYATEDARAYCMVGCIENFIQGKQPPWSDGRYNVPKYIELALNRGVCLLTGVKLGPDTGDPATFRTMNDFMSAFEIQMKHGAAEYMMHFRNENERYNRANYISPFLSCFCQDCIGRARDINDGGAVYPSVHGAGCMGIATVADSLAAIERLVYDEGKFTLGQLRDILAADFEGFEKARRLMLGAPKYGNGDEYVDKYAVWYVEKTEAMFAPYRTYDGGAIYTAIASNTQNIPAGREVAATPDGRRAREPMSDAASPMHGRDKNGPTAVVASTTRPDYTLVACGTVLNQKFSPSMFRDEEKRARLRALIRVYFEQGGQEMQINAVSRDMLAEAMENPDGYESLVVRVSGFSAYYTTLGRDVQQDILMRTEHE